MEKRKLREDWDNFFSPVILSRGYRYFEEGAVRSLRPEGDGWLAKVDGSQTYEVFAAPNPPDSVCTCPYFEDRGLCKHIAAACYEATYGQGVGEPETVDEAGTHGTSLPQKPAEILSQMDGEAVRSYLKMILDADGRWRDDFLHRFADLDARRLKLDFLNGISATVRDYSYRGFVDYRSAFQCELALSDYVHGFLDPLLDRGEYTATFELTAAFALHLQKIAIDDSDGFFDSMMSLAEIYWVEAFEHADFTLKRRMLEWMREFAVSGRDDSEDESGILWYARERVESFMLEHMAKDPEIAKDLIELAELILVEETARYEAALASESAPWGPYTGRLVLWARVKLQCMNLMGIPYEQQERFVLGCPPAFELIKPLVEKAQRSGKSERGLRLLEQHKEDARAVRYPTEASLLLLNLYEKSGNEEKALEELFDLSLNGRPQNDAQLRSWFRKLKRRAGSEWPRYEKRLVNGLASNQSRLRELYAETGDTEALAKSLQQGASRYEFERFRDRLLDSHPELYATMYEREIRHALFGCARSRDVYRENARLLAVLQSIPSGEETAEAIVSELRELYPRRRALMEELDKINARR